ncbi:MULTISPECIES: restriction endonuclease subunit S [Enterobacterales]|uniref:restriction endonuclease subunit S n=1 Tax=Enterobacterales TaxID=91347 RepID=UPI0019847418|nr:restriction endonuclease subunit S [Salmonella enterica]MCI3399319.1 restriction endonuclease subunit S [Escherichia coli]HAK2550597.1 restriction endonuclease subunit S [Salmonella enterica]HAK2692341.1 restriction endonuclease subunit S [Salmonella enterica]HAK2779405.1 restriction endonuclease subunit S [Salmonella enterica]
MNKLSYLEKLLDGVEVEWKTLEKVLKRTKGTKITAGQMKALHKDNAPLKIFAGGKTVAFVDFKDIPEKDINREPSIIVKSRGIIEFEYYDKPFSHKNEMWSYHSDNDAISIKYIYYFLKINEGYFQKIGGKMQMPQIATPDTDKFEVPIPCPDNPEKSLAIQAEIVRILDKFTALTAELTAELTARKKQYNYYRDQLLCFDEAEVEWKTLADVAILRRGRVMSKGYLEQNAGDYPVYSSQTARNGMIGSIDTYDFDGEFISWTTDGANAGTVFYRTGKFSITNVCGLIKIHENYPISYKYLYYWLSIEAQKHVYSGMGNPKLMSHQVEKITVPIPFPASPEKSMLEQQRIVGILDKLEAITFSLTEGLPREIELRQKQYEYYRDLLFSFPKPDSVTN